MNYKRVSQAADSSGSQILQSVTSFFITVSFVNCFTPDEFGAYSAFLIAWMLILSLNRTVFGEQLVVKGSGHTESTGYGVFMSLWLVALSILSLGVVGLVDVWGILPGVMFMVGFVASDAVRYWILSSSPQSYRVLTLGMLPVELVRTAVAFSSMWLALQDDTYAALTLAPIAGLLWVLLFAWQASRWRIRDAMAYLRGRDSFEGVMLTQYLSVTGVSQLLPTVAIGAFGSAAFGGLRLTQQFLAPATLVGTSLQPSLLRHFRKTAHEDIGHHLAKAVAVFLLIGIAMGSISLIVFSLLGRGIIPAGQYNLAAELVLPVVLAVTFVVLGQPGGAVIRVLRLAKISLWGQLLGVVVGVGLVLIASAHSIHLMAYALAASTATTVGATYVLLVRELRFRSRR